MYELSEITTDPGRSGLNTGIHRKWAIPEDVDLNRIVTGGVGNIMCSVCEDPSEIELPCKHKLCRKCFKNMRLCPKHEEAVKIDLRQIKPLETDCVLVKCPNNSKGCKTNMRLDELTTHLKTCDYKITQCSRCEDKMPLWQLGRHLNAGCEFRMDKCPFCSIIMTENDLSKHMKRCPRKHEDFCEVSFTINKCFKKLIRLVCPRRFTLFLGNISENLVWCVGILVILSFGVFGIVKLIISLSKE